MKFYYHQNSPQGPSPRQGQDHHHDHKQYFALPHILF